MSNLLINTRLQNGAFTVGKVLGQGGFGITYQGADMSLRRLVAIKEFFPDGCVRQGSNVAPRDSMNAAEYSIAKTKFLEEARTLARFHHPGIVAVHTFFEENNTAYMVMEYLKGKTLAQLVEERGALPETEALGHIQNIGAALEELHSFQLLHRDVKPENAIVCEDGRVVLIDFGLTKKVEEIIGLGTRQLAATTRFGSDGFAPPEQYLRNGVLGKYTDVYALGATLYFLLTGEIPISAPERAMGGVLTPVHQTNPNISRNVSDAIANAIALDKDKRPQTAGDFLLLLRSQVMSISPSANNSATTSALSTTKVLSTGQTFNGVPYDDVSRRFNYSRSARCFHCKATNYIPNSINEDDFIICHACKEKFGIIAPTNTAAIVPSSPTPLTAGAVEIGKVQFDLRGSREFSFEVCISLHTFGGGQQNIHIMTIPRDGRRSPQILSANKKTLRELRLLIEKAEELLD